jgi:NAD(P)-dependent dehydrogenase (short-subunit alcohol dehydrogenase family)
MFPQLILDYSGYDVPDMVQKLPRSILSYFEYNVPELVKGLGINFPELVHLALVHFAITSSVMALTYVAIIVFFRYATNERYSIDELMQILVSFMIPMGILLSERQEQVKFTPEDNLFDILKVLTNIVVMRWSFIVQIRGPRHESFVPFIENLSDKICIVTGGNSGIGLEVVKDMVFNKKCKRVIIASRDLKKCELVKFEMESASSSKTKTIIQCEELNLESFDSIRKFANKMLTELPHLDILVNNAASMIYQRQESKDGNEAMLQSNFLGTILLTLLLLPKLKQSPSARIVNVSSSTCRIFPDGKVLWENIQGDQSYFILTQYAHTKFLLNAMTRILARKLEMERIKNVTINGCHPGTVITNVTRYMPLWAQIGHHSLVYVNKSAKFGAQTILYLSFSKECEDKNGLFFEHCQVNVVPTISPQDEQRLIEFTEERLGLNIDQVIASLVSSKVLNGKQ